MKKALIVPFLLALVFILVGCVGGEFIELCTFIERWNIVAENTIDYSDFLVENIGDGTCYSLPLENEAVRLISDENGSIKICRVITAKKDSEGITKKLQEKEHSDFLEACKKAIIAYCNFSDEEASVLLNEFMLDELDTLNTEGELTKNQKGFNFAYYSTELASEFIITNTYLCEIESTLKPESKIAFAETTATRVETVPHE